jgi:hypothetical protein
MTDRQQERTIPRFVVVALGDESLIRHRCMGRRWACGSGRQLIDQTSWVEFAAALAARSRTASGAWPHRDRGAAGVRDTPYDRALSAPRSRRQAATKGA